MAFLVIGFDLLIYFFILIGIFFTGFLIYLRIFTSPYPDTYRSEKEKKFFNTVTGKEELFPSIEDPFQLHLSVIVPAYNEAKRLPPMLDECLTFLENRLLSNGAFKYEVIIVSDGSKDETVDVALKYSKKYGSDKIRVIELETNRGKGGAVYMGVQSARGALILFADADGASKFEDFSKLENALQMLTKNDYLKNPEAVEKSEVIVCGSRAHLEKEAIATRSFFRNILMHCFHFLVWLLTVRTVRDTQCGFKLLTRKAAVRCFKSLHVRRWAFDVELLFIAEKLNIPMTEVAIRWTEIEGSKLVPFWSWLQMGKDILFIWLNYRIGAWKIIESEKKN